MFGAMRDRAGADPFEWISFHVEMSARRSSNVSAWPRPDSRRITRELGARAAVLGGLVLTAGIGERSAAIRACAAWLGGPSIPTDEELMIARHTLAVLYQAPTAGAP